MPRTTLRTKTVKAKPPIRLIIPPARGLWRLRNNLVYARVLSSTPKTTTYSYVSGIRRRLKTEQFLSVFEKG